MARIPTSPVARAASIVGIVSSGSGGSLGGSLGGEGEGPATVIPGPRAVCRLGLYTVQITIKEMVDYEMRWELLANVVELTLRMRSLLLASASLQTALFFLLRMTLRSASMRYSSLCTISSALA